MFRLAPSSLRFSLIIAGVKVFQSGIVTKTAVLKPWLCVYMASILLAGGQNGKYDQAEKAAVNPLLQVRLMLL